MQSYFIKNLEFYTLTDVQIKKRVEINRHASDIQT